MLQNLFTCETFTCKIITNANGMCVLLGAFMWCFTTPHFQHVGSSQTFIFAFVCCQMNAQMQHTGAGLNYPCNRDDTPNSIKTS
jgi:hypothetical protein